MKTHHIAITHGPYRAEDLRSGDPYELSNGHLIECLPTGRQGSRANLLGGLVLDTDPAVESAGVDTGFSPHPGTLRAPDVAVGNIPNLPGWVAGAPLLAVEYADSGQDEKHLAKKITDLLQAGTQVVWVVNLVGQRWVDVYGSAREPSRYYPGEVLTATGILQNPVPVESLYDREAAHEASLRNLLQRRGYTSIEEIRRAGKTEGMTEGKAEGKAESLKRLLALRFELLPAWAADRIDHATVPELDGWIDAFLNAASIEDLLQG